MSSSSGFVLPELRRKRCQAEVLPRWIRSVLSLRELQYPFHDSQSVLFESSI